MHASEVTPEAAERANELYWRSDLSVNQIAEELDLSKGALYATLRPEPSGLGCPLCGDEVGYANRTAKDRGTLECPTCAWDGGTDEATGYTPPDAQEEGAGPSGGDATHDGEAGTDVVPSPPREDAPHTPLRTVIGGALIGGALGLALVMWARRR
jgi:hypothetical protein